MPTYHSVLVVGVGPGLSASFARLAARHGAKVALASRRPAELGGLAAEIGGAAHVCDAADPAAVAGLFAAVEAAQGAPDLVLYNPSFRVRGPLVELDPEQVRKSLEVSAFGAFLVAQQAARRMLPAGRGAIALTGASAGIKGFAQSAPFAMGKFALRGLAQSMAREFSPQGVHVFHVVVDGAIRSASRPDPVDAPDSTLDPDAIAEAIWAGVHQPRSAWAWEIELRPWVERF